MDRTVGDQTTYSWIFGGQVFQRQVKSLLVNTVAYLLFVGRRKTAIEIILNLASLDVIINEETVKAFHRLNRSGSGISVFVLRDDNYKKDCQSFYPRWI